MLRYSHNKVPALVQRGKDTLPLPTTRGIIQKLEEWCTGRFKTRIVALTCRAVHSG